MESLGSLEFWNLGGPEGPWQTLKVKNWFEGSWKSPQKVGRMSLMCSQNQKVPERSGRSVKVLVQKVQEIQEVIVQAIAISKFGLLFFCDI